jgi:PAS domain S-box-containing protein
MCLTISTIPIGIIGGIEGFQSSYLLIGLIFLVTFVVSIMISYLITRPLEKLTDNIIEISKGKLDVELAKSEIHEINNLTDSLNRIMASLKLAIHKVGVKKGEIFDDNKGLESKPLKQDDLIEKISGWIWETDKKGKFTFCSTNISKYLGYSPEEIIGKNYYDMISPDDYKQTKQVFSDAIKNMTTIDNLENWLIDNTGKKIFVRTNGVPVIDKSGNLKGYRGIITDITTEKESENKINELNTKISDLRSEIANISNDTKSVEEVEPLEDKTENEDEKQREQKIDYVFIFDENANVLACTDSMGEKLGYSKDEILSLNISDFDALETQQEIKDKIDQAKKNGHFSFKSIHKCKDGSKFLVYENFQYLKDKNAFRCIVKED